MFSKTIKFKDVGLVNSYFHEQMLSTAKLRILLQLIGVTGHDSIASYNLINSYKLACIKCSKLAILF